MKKIVIAALLILASVGVFAQAGTWYFSILPGYTFSQSGTDYTYYPYGYKMVERVRGDNQFMGSLDGGYFFNDNIGLHFAYLYAPGDFKTKLYWYYPGGGYIDEVSGSRQVNILEVGPEFIWGSKENQGYAQLNVGWTFGSGDTKYFWGGYTFDMGNEGGNNFAWGAAIGYRHYWGNTAFSVQAAYHNIDTWNVNNMWDLRLGVTWRF